MTSSKTVKRPISDFMPELIRLRRELHAHPEPSDNEQKTAEILTNFFRQFSPDEVIAPLGSNGIAFVFGSGRSGPTVVFRCELDAIPVEEKNDFAYRSRIPGLSHKCGHDGHMAIMVGLGYLISLNHPQKGQIILLFQPAEETGQAYMPITLLPCTIFLDIPLALSC
jgi:metal-dependent amidase/aminoacylase/carboxypeptidase family protein